MTLQLCSTSFKKTRKAAHNKRLTQWRVMWLIEHSTSHQLLLCIDSFVLRNPARTQSVGTLAVSLKDDNTTDK